MANIALHIHFDFPHGLVKGLVAYVVHVFLIFRVFVLCILTKMDKNFK